MIAVIYLAAIHTKAEIETTVEGDAEIADVINDKIFDFDSVKTYLPKVLLFLFNQSLFRFCKALYKNYAKKDSVEKKVSEDESLNKFNILRL